jgi:platelet-activating factor acetylhydrolase IB subunit alpha
MLSYLHSAGLRDTYEALKRETDNEDFTTDDPKAKWVGLLEKKWTSVIRLQKKVCSMTCMVAVHLSNHRRAARGRARQWAISG